MRIGLTIHLWNDNLGANNIHFLISESQTADYWLDQQDWGLGDLESLSPVFYMIVCRYLYLYSLLDWRHANLSHQHHTDQFNKWVTRHQSLEMMRFFWLCL
jgi:hypothetical protein